jgi:hypothetical protein
VFCILEWNKENENRRIQKKEKMLEQTMYGVGKGIVQSIEEKVANYWTTDNVYIGEMQPHDRLMENTILIGDDRHENKDLVMKNTIKIGNKEHDKIIIGGIDFKIEFQHLQKEIERLTKLTVRQSEFIQSMWFHEGMPGEWTLANQKMDENFKLPDLCFFHLHAPTEKKFQEPELSTK